jgi:hypothetical protein
MNIGHLNIPKPELDQVSFAHDLQIKLFLQYSKLIENETIGAQLLAALQEDQRVNALEGKMISRGGACPLRARFQGYGCCATRTKIPSPTLPVATSSQSPS